MSKMFKTVSPRAHFALGELSEEEIIALLEDSPLSAEANTCPEDEPMPAIGEIREAESKLFTQIVAGLTDGNMSYGQAVLLLAIYAVTIEDRVMMAMMS